jgi:hypothetical protein
MIIKILLTADIVLVILFLIFMIGISLSPKLRTETPIEGRKDYATTQDLLKITLPWVFIGIPPRVLGVATAKSHRIESVLFLVDLIVSLIVLVSLSWAIYCIYYNAKLRMKSATLSTSQ